LKELSKDIFTYPTASPRSVENSTFVPGVTQSRPELKVKDFRPVHLHQQKKMRQKMIADVDESVRAVKLESVPAEDVVQGPHSAPFGRAAIRALSAF
jgi:hypothetical protein